MNKKVLSDLENIPLLRREANINLWRHGLFFVAIFIASIFSNNFFSYIGLYFIGEISFFFTSIYPSFNWILSWIVAFFISIGFVLLSSEFIVQFINEETLSFFNQKNDFLEGFLDFKKINLTSEQLSVFIAILLAYIIFLLILFFRVSRKREILFLLDNGDIPTKTSSNIEETLKGKQSIKSKVTSNVDQLLKMGGDSFQSVKDKINNESILFHETISEDSIRDLESAIESFSSVIELDPNNIEAIEFRGYSYYLLQMFNEAILDFTKLIEIEGQELNLTIFQFRALAFFKLNKYQECIDDSSRVIECDNNFEYFYILRARALENIKNYPLAIKDYSYAIEINPENIETFFNRGESYLKIKKYRKAYVDLKKCYESDQVNESLLLSLIEVSTNLKYFSAVKKYCDQFISKNDQSDWVFCIRASNFLNEEKYEESINDFTRAIELNPINDQAYEGRGSVFYVLNRVEEATSDFRQAISINPDNQDCINFLEKINTDFNS